MGKLIQILLIFFLFTSSVYGIKSINIVEIGERENSFYGSFDLALNSEKGNSERERYSISISLQKFNSKDIWLFNTNYIFEQSKSENSGYQKTTNSSYLHIRNIRELSTNINWEYFGQVESNEFQYLAFRGLLGIGFRFKPFEQYKIYFGISPMFVRENYLNIDVETESSFKGNFYLNLKFNLTEKSDIIYRTRFSAALM